MRRRLAVLATSTAMALGVAVVVASPAEARNIGGFGGVCTTAPAPRSVQSANGAGQGAYCLCVIEPTTKQVLAGVNGPGTTCPPGILSLQPTPKPRG